MVVVVGILRGHGVAVVHLLSVLAIIFLGATEKSKVKTYPPP